MNHFEYKDGEKHCEEVSLSEIAREYGTPTYVYSAATLKRHFEVFDKALSAVDRLICFSVKANSNIAVLRLLASMGAGADIVSGGELVRALRAGIAPEKIVFSGVGKTAGEMRMALEAGILVFNVESRAELELLGKVAGEMGKRAPVSLRINPNVDAKTHPYISTGLQRNKFGIPWGAAKETYRRAAEISSIEVHGMDCHIGSQLTETEPFVDAANMLTVLIEELIAEDIALKAVDIGGGLGIPYQEPGEDRPPSPAIYGEAVVEALGVLRKHSLQLICEPGRVIAGNAGILLTEVLYCKESEIKKFVITDAAFNDLMRPALYSAYHPISPVMQTDRSKEVVDVVGPICETGDFFARDRELPEVRGGELLAIGAAGAYGFSMASNYNSRLRACEVLVMGAEHAAIRRRETIEQVLENESIPAFLD
ncbi:MAG: diaminopimelate decarboxylase [Myxococcales bacterium]|nr:diaminopimelate decarboxylase [Myxococcales bacterium]